MNETKPAFGTGLVRLIAVTSFAFILFMPVSQGTILMVVFALMALAAFLTYINTRKTLALPVATVAWLTILLGVYGLVVGLQNPGFLNAAGIFVATPLLFFFCIPALGQGSIRTLLTTGAIMTIVSGFFIVAYVGWQKGVLPQIIPTGVLTLTGAGFAASGDSTAIRFYGLSTLAASGPMWLASLFVRGDALLPNFVVRAAAAGAGVTGAILGGRRAIILTLLLIPIVALVVKRSAKAKSGPIHLKPGYLLGGLGIGFISVLAIPQIMSTPIVANTWRSTVSFFTGSTSDLSTDESVRTYQTDRLLDSWAESPVWGHGLGATINGFQRNESQPWQFEMQYPALLMQTGLLGVTILLVMALVIWKSIRRASELRPDLLPSLVVTLCGGAAMLIANATNPYLQAPAHHWAIFLPLAVINVMLSVQSSGEHPRSLDTAGSNSSRLHLQSRVSL